MMRYSSSHESILVSQIDLFFFWNYSMNNRFDTSKAEPGKLLAERINGWAAMMGFWAAVGAYLTTGQIIPGFV